MTGGEKMTIAFSQQAIDTILQRVRAYNWEHLPEPQGGQGSWAYGADKTYMRALCAYWLEKYDWRRFESALNRFANYRVRIDGQEIHYIHEKPRRADAPVVLLTHGWPGSVAEFMEAIPRLTRPEDFGGKAEDALEVIAPSLPGYGFSAAPASPIGPRATAKLWDSLARQCTAKGRYIAQGGDWGSLVSGYLGFHHAAKTADSEGCEAVHINMFGLRPADMTPTNDEEKNWLAAAGMNFEMEGAYFRIQATKPQTLAHGLMDSPVGAAAWIVEKFHRWSDLRDESGQEDIGNAYTMDQLLDNIMLYLLTGTFASSVWFYRGFFEEGGIGGVEGKIAVPCGIAVFPREFLPFPPRGMVERLYPVQRWSEFARGGHFAALEEPEAFSADLLAFANGLRGKK